MIFITEPSTTQTATWKSTQWMDDFYSDTPALEALLPKTNQQTQEGNLTSLESEEDLENLLMSVSSNSSENNGYSQDVFGKPDESNVVSSLELRQ